MHGHISIGNKIPEKKKKKTKKLYIHYIHISWYRSLSLTDLYLYILVNFKHLTPSVPFYIFYFVLWYCHKDFQITFEIIEFKKQFLLSGVLLQQLNSLERSGT